MSSTLFIAIDYFHCTKGYRIENEYFVLVLPTTYTIVYVVVVGWLVGSIEQPYEKFSPMP